MDPLFSTRSHTTCSVAGGDGLAFVLQRDPLGADAVGFAGAHMGYGGLKNSLAVSSRPTRLENDSKPRAYRDLVSRRFHSLLAACAPAPDPSRRYVGALDQCRGCYDVGTG